MPTFMGFMVPADGYGIAAKQVGKLLGAQGWDVVDMCLAADERWQTHDRTVAMCAADWLPVIDAPWLACYTMFESTRMPQFRVNILNRSAARVIVPCEWCAGVFYENGVRVPLSVVGLGVDRVDFPYLSRQREWGAGERPYTFLWSGTPDRRKGWDLAYRCFIRAFGRDPGVQLVLHFRDLPKAVKGCRDPNVKLLGGRLTHGKLLEMLAEADCFVFPSRGEGWGQPPREAASTGLPVIATDFAGLEVGLADWGLPLRVKGFSRAEFGFWGDEDLGYWAEPDPEHLIERMRWCYEHRDEAAALGVLASAWLAHHATWEQTAAGIGRWGDGETGRSEVETAASAAGPASAVAGEEPTPSPAAAVARGDRRRDR
jgi:glycosyltransferase involved in cell wall biosynthesis